MPRPKRWCNISQDLLDDPEFQTLCDTFGIAGVKFFLFIMGMLDKTDNHICLHTQVSIKHWAARIGSTRKQCLAIYQLLIDYRWISVGVTEDQRMFLYARNYAKYRGNRGHESDMTKQVSSSPPSLPFPFLKKEIKEKSFFDSSLISKEAAKEAKVRKSTVPPAGVYCKLHYDRSVICMERIHVDTEMERTELVENGWLCDHHKENFAGQTDENTISPLPTEDEKCKP